MAMSDPYSYFQQKSFGTDRLLSFDEGGVPVVTAEYLVVLKLHDLPADQVAPQDIVPRAEALLHNVLKAGLEVQVQVLSKNPSDKRLLLFISCPTDRLLREAIKRRIHDFVAGVYGVDIHRLKDRTSLDDITAAEKLRLIHYIISEPVAKGGAGLVEVEQPNGLVEVVTPLHDQDFNAFWASKWAKSWGWVAPEDITNIKNHFGEKVGFYFAFIRYYTMWQVVPSVIGLFGFLFMHDFSPLFGMFIVFWSLLFTLFWEQEQTSLAVAWKVKNCSLISDRLPGFKGIRQEQDMTTGEIKDVFPKNERLKRQTLSILKFGAFFLLWTLVLSGIFVIEFIIHDAKLVPGLNFLVRVIPTMVYAVSVKLGYRVFMKYATKLNEWENYETDAQFDAKLTEKVFVYNIITAFLPLLLIAYVYMPFGDVLLGLSQTHLGVDSAVHLEIHAGLLRKRLLTLLITGQLASFFSETFLPYILRKKEQVAAAAKAQYRLRKAHKANDTDSPASQHLTPPATQGSGATADLQQNALYKLYRANSLHVPAYNPFSDFAEMATQFGYISLFSIIWPLAPLAGLINNAIEVKSDLWKLCHHCRRPIPRRTEDIGPWLRILGLLSWGSTITNMSLVVLFFNWSIIPTPAWFDLIIMIVFEHLYFMIRYILKNTVIGTREDVKDLLKKEQFEHRNYITKELGLKLD